MGWGQLPLVWNAENVGFPGQPPTSGNAENVDYFLEIVSLSKQCAFNKKYLQTNWKHFWLMKYDSPHGCLCLLKQLVPFIFIPYSCFLCISYSCRCIDFKFRCTNSMCTNIWHSLMAGANNCTLLRLLHNHKHDIFDQLGVGVNVLGNIKCHAS